MATTVKTGTRRAGRRGSTALAVVLGLLWWWAPTATAQETVGASSAGDGFHSVAVTRVMDTRVGFGGPTFGGETRALTIGGTAGVPASGAVAVALNVTAVGPTTHSYLTVWPGGTEKPGTSNLNFRPGETRANAVVTGVDAAGTVLIANAVGEVDVIVDVTAWWSGDFVGVVPARLADTRETTPFGPGEARSLQVAGAGGVPGSGATAVAITITVTNPTADGYVTVWPEGTPPPDTSNVNFGPGATTAATALVGLGPTGGISILNVGGTADVIVDVMGWYSAGFTAVAPARLLDTRDGSGRCGLFLAADEIRTITIAGVGGVPPTGVAGAVLTLTATATAYQPGFLTVWPTGSPPPFASNLNYLPGETVANTVVVGLGTAGQVSILNQGGSTEVVLDVNGAFAGATPAGTPVPCPSLTTTTQAPLPGRRMPDGTITTAAFNAMLAELGPAAPITKSPLRLGLALSGGELKSALVTATVRDDLYSVVDVAIDDQHLFDDSFGGVHSDASFTRQPDGTYRVSAATWGYICLRRPSPPYTPELCP